MKPTIYSICSIAVLLLTSTLTFVTAEEEEHGKPGDEKAVSLAHWAYDGAEGPANWGGLDPAYSVCGTGQKQSPIDITGSDKSIGRDIEFIYRKSNLHIVNNGHTIQQNYDVGSVLRVGEDKYFLAQFHFHAPSEHKFQGEHYAMEMHLVHVNVKRELAVVGVFIEQGQTSIPLQRLFQDMPSSANQTVDIENAALNVSDVLPNGKSYYRYSGSLTTPPCSEGVKWFVLRNAIEASEEQIAKFSRVIGYNARPSQPLNQRVVSIAK